MKKQSIIFPSIILIIVLGIFSYNHLQTALPEIVFRAQTQKEAFSDCIYLMKNLKWFKENQYNVTLPQHKAFSKIYSNKQKIS